MVMKGFSNTYRTLDVAERALLYFACHGFKTLGPTLTTGGFRVDCAWVGS